MFPVFQCIIMLIDLILQTDRLLFVGMPPRAIRYDGLHFSQHHWGQLGIVTSCEMVFAALARERPWLPLWGSCQRS